MYDLDLIHNQHPSLVINSLEIGLEIPPQSLLLARVRLPAWGPARAEDTYARVGGRLGGRLGSKGTRSRLVEQIFARFDQKLHME